MNLYSSTTIQLRLVTCLVCCLEKKNEPWGNPEVEEFSSVFPRVEVIIFWGALHRTEQEIL